MDDIILEPVKAYNQKYKEELLVNANKAFDEKIEKSGVNVEKCREAAENYRGKCAELENFNKLLKKQKILRVVLIICSVLFCFTIVAPIVLLIPVFKKVNPKIKEMNLAQDKLEEQRDKLLAEAERLTAPLKLLFDDGTVPAVITDTVPTVQLDRNYSMRRFDYLNGKYGFDEASDAKTSTVGLISGEIEGNPFLFEARKHCKMGTCPYTGTLPISWTETYVDSEGKTRTRTRTQILTATVIKPKPYYNNSVRLIYGNDAAPDLSFTHEPSHAENMSEKELRREVKSGLKKIRKKSKKEIASGFTELGNEEFDALFGALDRDNEVQFRLLFTPLAQREMLSLMKGESPFGDDFRFEKRGCLNYIISEHSQNREYDFSPRNYDSYDIDIFRELFLQYTADVFRGMFFDLAPLLSIPLYQQHKPTEYIYKDVYPQNYTTREAEVLANSFDSVFLASPSSDTDVIMKAKHVSKQEDEDTVEITAHSYSAQPRMDFVPTLGGDGHIHAVPVPWTEYVPTSKTTLIGITARDKDDNETVCGAEKHGLKAYVLT